MRVNYKELYLDIVNSVGFANSELVKEPEKVKTDFQELLSGRKNNFGDGVAIWQQVQLYLWKEVFLNHKQN
jgi:hypothetical protein